jgi:acyl transferase domain-containing protein
VIARAFSFQVGLQFVVVRATLLRANPAHPGGMAAVAASEEKVARYISKLDIDGRVAIAVYNGPESHVVSGELKAIEKLISVVKADGIRATKLVVDQGEFNIVISQMFSDPLSGFHSPSIAPALPALKAWLDEHEASFNVLEKPFFSTLRGKEIAKHEHLGSEYWVSSALCDLTSWTDRKLNRLTMPRMLSDLFRLLGLLTSPLPLT